MIRATGLWLKAAIRCTLPPNTSVYQSVPSGPSVSHAGPSALEANVFSCDMSGSPFAPLGANQMHWRA